jgi:hypothetical protein
VPSPSLSPGRSPCGSETRVGRGETLFSIARRCETSVPAIEAVNPGLDPHRLRAGQTLRLKVPTLADRIPVPPQIELPARPPVVERPADDTLRFIAVERLEVDDGRLVLTIGQRPTLLPDGMYRSDEGDRFRVRKGRITELGRIGLRARPDRRRAEQRPVRRIRIIGTSVYNGQLHLQTREGRSVSLAEGLYRNENGVNVQVARGQPISVGRLHAEQMVGLDASATEPDGTVLVPSVDIDDPEPGKEEDDEGESDPDPVFTFPPIIPEIIVPDFPVVPDVAEPTSPEPEGPARLQVRFTEDGGHLIPLADGFVENALPAAVRSRVESLYTDQKRIKHLDLAEARSAAFVTSQDEPYMVQPSFGRCLMTPPPQEAAMEALTAQLDALHQTEREIDALAVSPSGTSWIVVSGQDVYSMAIPPGLLAAAQQLVQSGTPIDLIAITPGEPGGFLLAGGGQIIADQIPPSVEATLAEMMTAGLLQEPIHDVAFNPSSYNREADLGWVVVGEETFVSRGNTQKLCDDLAELGRTGPCHAVASPPPAQFEFGPDRPKLIALVHGATQQPPKHFVGEYRHAQHYWGFGFIRVLLGEQSGNLRTLNNTTLEASK